MIITVALTITTWKSLIFPFVCTTILIILIIVGRDIIQREIICFRNKSICCRICNQEILCRIYLGSSLFVGKEELSSTVCSILGEAADRNWNIRGRIITVIALIFRVG